MPDHTPTTHQQAPTPVTVPDQVSDRIMVVAGLRCLVKEAIGRTGTTAITKFESFASYISRYFLYRVLLAVINQIMFFFRICAFFSYSA